MITELIIQNHAGNKSAADGRTEAEPDRNGPVTSERKRELNRKSVSGYYFRVVSVIVLEGREKDECLKETWAFL